jgi:uncharacterized membrane protein YeaQ/YmgE (transglycosylase-associated protein family)
VKHGIRNPNRRHDDDGDETMGFFGWIILGLLAGAIAKAILPGRQGGGWFVTLILGVVGALLGGWLGSAIFGIGLENFFSLQTWILAIVGSIIVLLIYGLVTRGSRGSRRRA